MHQKGGEEGGNPGTDFPEVIRMLGAATRGGGGGNAFALLKVLATWWKVESGVRCQSQEGVRKAKKPGPRGMTHGAPCALGQACNGAAGWRLVVMAEQVRDSVHRLNSFGGVLSRAQNGTPPP